MHHTPAGWQDAAETSSCGLPGALCISGPEMSLQEGRELVVRLKAWCFPEAGADCWEPLVSDVVCVVP